MKCLGDMERDIGGIVETLVTYSDLYVDHAWFYGRLRKYAFPRNNVLLYNYLNFRTKANKKAAYGRN